MENRFKLLFIFLFLNLPIAAKHSVLILSIDTFRPDFIQPYNRMLKTPGLEENK